MLSLFARFNQRRNAIIEHLLKDPAPRVRHALLNNPHMPDSIRRQLQDDDEVTDYDPYDFIENQPGDLESVFWDNLKQGLAEEPDTPLDVLLRLTQDSDNYTAGLAVQHPAMPVEKLHEFARNPDFAMFVASHPRCPREYLEKFSRHSDGGLRSTLAERPGTPAAILERLAGSYESSIRADVAANPAAPASLLLRLMHDANEDVRKAVAGNPSAPPEALAALAKDSESSIRINVAENPATPLSILMALFEAMDTYSSLLSSDEDETGLEAMDDETFEESGSEELYGDPWNNLYICRRIAAHPAIPVGQLQEWSTKNEGILLSGVAGNPNAPTDLLLKIVRQGPLTNKETLGRVARNPAANEEILSLLADYGSSEIRIEVAAHTNTPPAILVRLAADHDDDVRLKLAERTTPPPEVLEMLAADDNDRIRWLVACCAGTPLEALKRLAEDDEEEIRANVARHIRPDA